MNRRSRRTNKQFPLATTAAELNPGPLAQLRQRLRVPWLTSRRARWVLVAALLLAAASTAVTEKNHDARAEIVVAAKDLVPGRPVQADDLQLASYPVALLPAGALHTIADAQGRTAAAGLRAGQPLTDLSIVTPRLAGHVIDGEASAVPVEISDPTFAEVLRSGDVVDVYTATDAGPAAVAPRLLARNATVLVVLDRPHNSGQSAKRSALLALPSKDAGIVAVADRNGEIAFVLH